MTFEVGRRVHIVGVGGAGMSGVARLLSERGCRVSGSDAQAGPVLDELVAHGVRVDVGADATHGADAEVVLWSPAVAADHPELAAARVRGATLLPRADLLAELGRLQPVVGITGTHGKTTATSMLVWVMSAAGRDDSRLLGAPVRGVGANGHWGGPDLLLEVDESYGTFARLAPAALGLLNVEADHLDHYGSVEALHDAFVDLVERTTGPVAVWIDDPGAAAVARRVGRDVRTVGATADVRLGEVRVDATGTRARLTHPEAGEVALDLAVPGRHNAIDAAVVATLCLDLGIERSAVERGLASFHGAPRRFDRRGHWHGAVVIEDYAHLPGEIRATVQATRAAGYDRVVAVFQPHRVSRTVALAAQFAGAFDDADEVIITDLYAAGEPNPEGVTGRVVSDVVAGGRAGVHYAATPSEVITVLEESVAGRPADAVLLLGAGDIAARVVDGLEGLEP